MTAKDNLFEPRSTEDVRKLVLEHPLAWLVSCGGEEFRASLLPVRPGASDGGRLECLMGHFARSNRHVAVLRREPVAWMLFLGPNGYVSPSWMRDRTRAPSWNYASAQFRVEVEFFEDAPTIDAHLRDLVGAMEAGPGAWSAGEMGERYDQLARRVIGFRAWIRETRPRFKLGQDERDDVYGDIVAGLGQVGGRTLAAWMQRANPGRLPED